eukprot:GHVN01010622.1.p2 GENE.GHVN01010622.1~~GHVN01010622.1.p2  ORF type:complete len:437 (+),score=67.73 GHVN01010622.1:1843-3153(+)
METPSMKRSVKPKTSCEGDQGIKRAVDENGQLLVDDDENPIYMQLKPKLNSNCHPITDENGEPIYEVNSIKPKMDAYGNLMLDNDGNAMYDTVKPETAGRNIPIMKNVVDENGQPLVDDDGNPIYQQLKPQLNSNGNPIFDESGKPIYEVEYIKPKFDANGKLILDRDGNAIYDTVKPDTAGKGGHGTKQAVGGDGRPLLTSGSAVIEPAVVQNGQPPVDDDRNPIEKQLQPKLDSRGNPIFDENGKPIYDTGKPNDDIHGATTAPVTARDVNDKPKVGPLVDNTNPIQTTGSPKDGAQGVAGSPASDRSANEETAAPPVDDEENHIHKQLNPKLNSDGNPMVDENGNPIADLQYLKPKLDASRNPMVDKDGNPIYETIKPETTGNSGQGAPKCLGCVWCLQQVGVMTMFAPRKGKDNMLRKKSTSALLKTKGENG